MLRAAAVALLNAGVLLAQGRSRLELDFAMQHLAHRDAVASPLAYSGAGLGGALAYTRRAWGFDTRLAMSVFTPTLESAISAGGIPREHVARVGMDLRSLPVRSGWRAGPRFSADLAYRDHLGSGSGGWSFGYLFAHLGAGLTLEGSSRLGATRFLYEIGIPLVGMVSRPYTDTRITSGSGMDWRFVAPHSLQTADARLTWALTRNMAFAYHCYLAIYDKETPYRALENSFGLRLSLGRLGEGR